MDNLDILLKVMMISEKILNKDISVVQDLTDLENSQIPEDIQSGIDSFENNIAIKMSSDSSLAVFIADILYSSTIFDLPYISSIAYVYDAKGISPEKIISLLNENKNFSKKYKTLNFLQSLAIAAISSSNEEAISLAKLKISEVINS